jgi:hypothetical protein
MGRRVKRNGAALALIGALLALQTATAALAGAAGTAPIDLVAIAPAAHADPVSGRLALESAGKGSGTCQDPGAVCLPDGIYTITVGNTNPAACRFDVSISWGDGAADSFSIGPTRDVSHHYTYPGVYTISVSGVGTPLESGATCTGDSGTVRVEVPAAPEITQKAESLGEVSGLAGSFAERLKKFLKLKLNRESKKLRKRVDRLVRDGKEAKSLRRELRQLGVPEEGEIAYPCPAPRVTARRACPGGEVVEKLEDLYGFLESLKELARYPEYQRKKADQYYQTQEGEVRMDALTNLCGDCGGKTKYSQLNDEQKQIIASQVQVHSGAVRKALRDAQKAGKAGTEVSF